MNYFKKTGIITLIISLVFGSLTLMPRTATAASVTSFSDTLSRLKTGVAANHEIIFVTPTGVTSAQTITVTFSSDFTGLGSIVEDDVDFATGSSGTCSSATYTEQATATSPSGATWGVSVAGQVITITSGTGTVTAARCVRIRVGTNATNSGTGANQISNGSADDDDTIAIAGSFTDTGTAMVDIIADDQVVITATVDPTFTLTIDDNAIGFGSLTSGAVRYATANAAGSGTDVAANTFTISTNAPSGYTLTYNGPTLTSGLNTITAATITSDADGTPGSSQFALGAAVTGVGTPASGYNNATPDWKFVASTTSTLASATAAAASDSIAIHYLANISGATPAGSYTTTLTYIGTGNF